MEKENGIYIITYLFFIGIMLNLKLYIQAFMITLLGLTYIYYKKYYSSLTEFFNTTKKTLNNVISLNPKINNTILNQDFNDNNNNINNNNINNININQQKNIERNVIKEIPTVAKLNELKTKMLEYVDIHVPQYQFPSLQVPQEDLIEKTKRNLEELFVRHYNLYNKILTEPSSQLNYYQQIKKVQSDILTIIHNTIFLSNTNEEPANELITEAINVFNIINNELAKKNNNTEIIHKGYEYIPTNNELKAANSFNYDSSLF